MQDRLKSRIWDAETKTMHYTDFVITSTGYVAKLQPMYELEEDENGDEIEIQSEKEFMIDQTDLDFDKTMVVMQCTGMKDKNSQLIYESDILEDPVHKFKVAWSGYSFVISGASKNDEEKQVYFFPLLAQTFEVIGNIYENPELLKGGCNV